jgi:hypothetical protein
MNAPTRPILRWHGGPGRTVRVVWALESKDFDEKRIQFLTASSAAAQSWSMLCVPESFSIHSVSRQTATHASMRALMSSRSLFNTGPGLFPTVFAKSLRPAPRWLAWNSDVA